MNRYFIKKLLLKTTVIALFFSGNSCTNLEEDLNGNLSLDPTITPESLLSGTYNSLRDLQSQDNWLAATEHSTDEMAGPTRGTDWDDAGVWRVLHTHSWDKTHNFLNFIWNSLNGGEFNAYNTICQGATGQTLAEATALRVFFNFQLLDNYGIVLRRECGEVLTGSPSIILYRSEAIDVLISDLEAVLNDLPETNNPKVASKNMARMLLAKLYLNKSVYKATELGATQIPQAGPYNFDTADMNKAIGYIDDITGVSLDSKYFTPFTPQNSETSNELVFVSENLGGSSSGNVRSRWFMTTHYNQNPSGWNGFVALSDLYNKFESTDSRLNSDLNDYINAGPEADNVGYNAGLLIGQQFNASGTALTDRQNNPLSFTESFSLASSNEVAGIRAIKYIPDVNNGDNVDNDFVFFRLSDALLMKAEAILRGGSPTNGDTAQSLVNEVRSRAGATILSSVDLQTVLDERARELYWEGWRRNDQIRFGTFLGTWQEKSTPSESYRLLFPIPANATAVIPELVQNQGY